MTSRRFGYSLAAGLMVVALLAGCVPMMTQTVVTLSRERYTPRITPDNYKAIWGKRILFHGITDQSQNTSNFAFYNRGKTVGYELYYTLPNQGMPQPLVSFFWYALKKGFERAGLVIEDTSPIYDVELLMVFRSLSDREVQFDTLLRRAGKRLYERGYTVESPGGHSTDSAVLEQRAYGMIDAIVRKILDDPDFKKALLK